MCLAVPGKVIKMIDTNPLARKAHVSFGGFVREVSLVLQPDALVGDYVIVHAGFAIATVDEREAQRTIAEFESISDYIADEEEQ